MNDKEFDKLISRAFEDEEMLEDLNKEIMKTVRATEPERPRFLDYLRLAAFSFMISMVPLVYLLTYNILIKLQMPTYVMLCLFLSAIISFIFCGRTISRFSVMREK